MRLVNGPLAMHRAHFAALFAAFVFSHIPSGGILAHDAREVVAAAHANFPPYYPNDDSGKPGGFAILFLKIAAKPAEDIT